MVAGTTMSVGPGVPVGPVYSYAPGPAVAVRTGAAGGAADAGGDAGILDCGTAGPVCFDGGGEPVKEWVNVGAGKGSYEVSQQYVPAAGGSYELVEVSRGGGSSWRVMLCFLCVVLAVVLGVVVFLVLRPSEEKKIETRTVEAPAPPPPPAYDCSTGTWTRTLEGEVQLALKNFRSEQFKLHDLNHDGSLSARELPAAGTAWPSCKLNVAAGFPGEESGSLSLSDMEMSLSRAPTDAAFAFSDANCDGKLSKAEVAGLRAHSSLPQQAKLLLEGADVDADGHVTAEEFSAALQKASSMVKSIAGTGEQLWSHAKKSWCCTHEGLACGTVTYDCGANADKWETMWTHEKQNFCCSTKGVGCPKSSAEYDCHYTYDNHIEAWSAPKKEYCCQTYKRGCETTVGSYDCAAGYNNWMKGWSDAKKVWCCNHESKGCSTEPFHCGAENGEKVVDPSSWPAPRQTYCCEQHGVGCNDKIAKPKFNCREDWPHWEGKWTADKQEYCCSQYGRGCKEVPAAPALSEPFDCKAGLINWVKGWSDDKKAYCCKAHAKGCPHAVHYFCKGDSSLWDDAESAWCCKNYHTGCKAKYDCEDGSWNWVKGWSDAKKAWCCENESKGCDVHHVDVALKPDYTKHEQQFQGFKHWHAEHVHTGTGFSIASVAANVKFDCQAALTNWRAAWSDPKKEWCCKHEEKGCEGGL